MSTADSVVPFDQALIIVTEKFQNWKNGPTDHEYLETIFGLVNSFIGSKWSEKDRITVDQCAVQFACSILDRMLLDKVQSKQFRNQVTQAEVEQVVQKVLRVIITENNFKVTQFDEW